MYRKTFILLTCLLLSATVMAQSEVTFTESPSEGGLALVSDEGMSPIVVAENEEEVVRTAAECLVEDLQLVTGKKTEVVSDMPSSGTAVIAGTVGTSALLRQLSEAGKLDISAVAGKWEAYGLQVVDRPAEGIERALVVFGSTPRGTAYGLFDISRGAGVSPLVWWADVNPAKRAAVYASSGRTIVGEPSVKYRGIFINDEDFGLQPWAAKGPDKAYNNIGPNTYTKVMELLLRLRANTLWPAMHASSRAFWDNKDNLPIAKKYDIMLGSSHCEQMLRDNEWEWRRAPYNGTNEDWNYVTNKTKIQNYWEERVKESVGYDAMYTLGMRGVHDWAISGYPSTQDKVNGLTEIIGFQRSLLDKYMGNATQVPQLFIPYKEVLDAYNAGLKVPEDITLCWVDDNHGYIRQMPKATEQARSGGNGVYYHFSYWGTPADYLWLCSHSPALTSYELSKAYQQGIQTLWIINVGDIKPAEMELEFAMDLAWDVEQWCPEKAAGYNRYWAAKTFGENVAEAIANIKSEYYRLAANGKPEHIFLVDYTNEEMEQRMADYAEIARQVDDVKANIPAELLDAYFQLVEYPVKGAYYMNVKTFRATQSLSLARSGHRDQALEYAAESRKAYRQIADLTGKYNKEIANGKWDGIMSFKPRGLAQFNMPETASLSNIGNVVMDMPEESPATVIPATAYTASNGAEFTTVEGLGVSGKSITIWPLDMNTYSATRAPYVEYDVPVKAGMNTIAVRCLPTFPVNTDYNLRVALSIDGKRATAISLKTTATEGKWNQTVVQGFNDASVEYESNGEQTVKLRVALLDPGIVISDIHVSQPAKEDLELTERLIRNYDFEMNANCEENPTGNIGRGVPCGWNQKGKLNKGSNGLDSYGVNQDATNYHGNNVCWFNSVPMPADFELSQTIPASELEAGTYRISCLLWVENGKKTTCRLFANDNVQYYGYESDYTNLLTSGEINTFAGYAGGDAGNIVLKEMEVYVTANENEDLTLGIKTSNKKNDGTTATDNAGWFKVDYFRINKVSNVPPQKDEDLALTEQVIRNYDFELYQSGNNILENTSGDTRRYTPYGWNITGAFPGQSYGINRDAGNPHKTNVAWCLPQGGYFPDGFELYQVVKAEDLTPGRYLVQCKLWVEENYLGTTRLFANNQVQYYGMDIDYENNLTSGEENSFAGYIGGTNGNFILQDMYVYVDLKEGENLRLGIRSDARQSNGTLHPEYKNGWFKTDYFRINKVEETALNQPVTALNQHTNTIYDLQGRQVSRQPAKGFYIKNGQKYVVR
ncbi:MAG: glycosyl hydrolase 115 family protein [Prevotella sp.]|nr:glycosyl hydrolase 115 family protein [Prevotella sp.]